MLALDAIRTALATVPVRRLKATLLRCVALQPLIEGGSPDFLFASGRANRYNRPVRAELDRETILTPLGRLSELLVKRLHLTSVEQAFEIISRYYPPERIPARTQYLLEDVFNDLRRRA
jgi:hypothetical protein